MTLQQQIDQLAKIKARMDLDKKAHAELLNSIKANGAGTYEGTEFDLTISVSERKNLDMKAVREKLSRQFIVANTKISEIVSHSWRAK